MLKTKIFMATAAFLLGASGAAFAATGHVPEAVKTFMGSTTGSTVTGDQDSGPEMGAVDDQYSENEVCDIAKDKSAVGTKTLPNGKEIENHGMAVSQAARAQYHDEEDRSEERRVGKDCR